MHIAIRERELEPMNGGIEVPEASTNERDVVRGDIVLLSSRNELVNPLLGLSALPGYGMHVACDRERFGVAA